LTEALLQTEKLVHSLADELLKLKSAVERYEDNRKSLDAVRESMQRSQFFTPNEDLTGGMFAGVKEKKSHIQPHVCSIRFA
jgi:hypothetical protein